MMYNTVQRSVQSHSVFRAQIVLPIDLTIPTVEKLRNFGVCFWSADWHVAVQQRADYD